ncbi:unnamed protein product [Phytophthora fragariaefolia]|uniref:Unnamed protein product n=1 Tax=Phytophthora fragariaefolia TaxID=1490495 RepID=A0A9W6Y0X4_9STRA|nr:unnamed protein product [Phytophthora fragariaefolia]
MWHGSFRVTERVNDFAVRLETAGTPYQLFPIVHVSKLKAAREFPSLPMVQLTISADERFDFDEELLPDDSWSAQELEDDVFEVEEILDTCESRATLYGRTRRVRWKGYPDHTWVDEADLNCGGMLEGGLSGAVKVDGGRQQEGGGNACFWEVARAREIVRWEVWRASQLAEDGTTEGRLMKKAWKETTEKAEQNEPNDAVRMVKACYYLRDVKRARWLG